MLLALLFFHQIITLCVFATRQNFMYFSLTNKNVNKIRFEKHFCTLCIMVKSSECIVNTFMYLHPTSHNKHPTFHHLNGILFFTHIPVFWIIKMTHSSTQHKHPVGIQVQRAHHENQNSRHRHPWPMRLNRTNIIIKHQD